MKMCLVCIETAPAWSKFFMRLPKREREMNAASVEALEGLRGLSGAQVPRVPRPNSGSRVNF